MAELLEIDAFLNKAQAAEEIIGSYLPPQQEYLANRIVEALQDAGLLRD